jgi:hypothetical protein
MTGQPEGLRPIMLQNEGDQERAPPRQLGRSLIGTNNQEQRPFFGRGTLRSYSPPRRDGLAPLAGTNQAKIVTEGRWPGSPDLAQFNRPQSPGSRTWFPEAVASIGIQRRQHFFPDDEQFAQNPSEGEENWRQLDIGERNEGGSTQEKERKMPLDQRTPAEMENRRPVKGDQDGLLERLLSLLTKDEKEKLAKRIFEREKEESLPRMRTYSSPLHRESVSFKGPSQEPRQPTHSLLQQSADQKQNQKVGSTYLSEGMLPPREGGQRYAEGETLSRAPRRMDPIMNPVGAPSLTKVPQHMNMLYGPPLPVFEPDVRENMAAKAFNTPRFTAFAGSPDEEGQKTRHFLGLVEMHASVTRGITDSQKILIAVSNLKGAAYEWFFNTNDRHAELYGGQSLFSSFEKFRQFFLQRFGQMNTATSIAQLENVKLRKGETVATFAQKLENLFYSANLVDEQAKLYYFFRAIDDPLKSQVRVCKPLTLNQAIQDAIHFDQRMSRDEQDRSRFINKEAATTWNRNSSVKKIEEELEEGNSNERNERPPVGTSKNKFPKKYDPGGQAEKNTTDDNPHKDIACYNCQKKGHYASSCEEPKRPRNEAITRSAQEEKDALNDILEGEPDFDSLALVRIIEDKLPPNDHEEPIFDLPTEKFVGTIRMMKGRRLGPSLPRKRVPYPIDEGDFVTPLQQGGLDLEPFMALSAPEREEGRRQRQESCQETQESLANRLQSQPTVRNSPGQSLETFPVKWMPTKEILKGCTPNLISDLRQAAQAAKDAQEDDLQAVVQLPVLPEHLVIAPKKQWPPLTRVAGRSGGVHGQPQILCLDSGANNGTINEELSKENGLTEQIKLEKPTFSTADRRLAAGVGWINTKIGVGSQLEVTTRFVVGKNFDFQVLLGVNALKPLQGAIDFNKGCFRLKLPESGLWRSLPLVEKEGKEQVGMDMVETLEQNVPDQYVDQLVHALLAERQWIIEEGQNDPAWDSGPGSTQAAPTEQGIDNLLELTPPDDFDQECYAVLDKKHVPYERTYGELVECSIDQTYQGGLLDSIGGQLLNGLKEGSKMTFQTWSMMSQTMKAHRTKG